jgi:hypothetical protein
LRKPDFSKVFILYINWNALGISVILGQLDEKGKEYVIAYASQSNNKAESTYSSYEVECFDVVWLSYILGPIFMAPSSLLLQPYFERL